MAGAPWHEFEHERNFYEAIFVVVLVCLAVLFEVVSHWLRHSVEHSYSYGASRDRHQHEEDRKVPHKQLYRELVERLQGEFMTLGFLACLVFFGNTYGFFELLAEALTPEGARRLATSGSTDGSAGSGHGSAYFFVQGPLDMAMPHNGGHWLHLAEEVHIRLFFGMLFYQFVIFSIVRAGVHQVQTWSELTNRKMQCQKGFEVVNDLQLRNYHELQRFFVAQLARWQDSQRSRWEQLERQVWLEDPEPEPEEGYDTAATLEKLDGALSLSHYLSYCVEEGLVELIEVSHLTWAVLLAFFVVCLPLHAFLQVTMAWLAGTILPACVLCLFVVIWAVNYREGKRRREASKDEQVSHRSTSQQEPVSTSSGRLSRRTSVTSVTLEIKAVSQVTGFAWSGKPLLGQAAFVQSMEVLLFLWSYSFSSILLDQLGWKAHPLLTVVEVLIYLFFTAMALVFLPRLVVHLLTHTSMPRYLSQRHFESLCRVLREADPAICDMLRCGQISLDDLPQGSPTRAHVSPNRAFASPRKLGLLCGTSGTAGAEDELVLGDGCPSVSLPVRIERSSCHKSMAAALQSALSSAEGHALITRLMNDFAGAKDFSQPDACALDVPLPPTMEQSDTPDMNV